MRNMINGRIAVRTLLAATGVLAAVSMTACTGSATGSLSVNGQQHTAASTSSTPSSGSSVGSSSQSVETTVAGPPGETSVGTAPGNRPTSPATVANAAIPECAANSLRLGFGGQDAGMSQRWTALRFTNVGRRSCVISGFPGVSYVTGDNGTQVGAPAVRTGPMGGRIVLAPGQVASDVIHSVVVGVFDPAQCKPTPVRGYRVYAPSDTAAMFIPLPAGVEGCAGNPPDPQLSVDTIKPGPGNPAQP